MGLLTLEQGNAILAILQMAFAVMLWPTARDPLAQVPRRTSVPTATGIWLMALTFWAMGPAWLPATTSAICGAMWTAIAILRPVRVIAVASTIRLAGKPMPGGNTVVTNMTASYGEDFTEGRTP